MSEKPTIIFVDDDLNIRESIKRVLRLKPYRVLAVESAKHCVEILAVTSVQVLITDLAMPGVNGKTLINFFKETKPEVVRIVLSGKLDLAVTLDLINKGEVFRCLEKPCSSSVLLTAVDDALKFWKERNSTLSSQKTEHGSVTTTLIREAVQEVERLEKSLDQYSEIERSVSTK